MVLLDEIQERLELVARLREKADPIAAERSYGADALRLEIPTFDGILIYSRPNADTPFAFESFDA